MQRRWLWLALVILVFDIWMIYRWYHQRNDHRFDGRILQVARRYEIDPALVKAVIWRESSFNPRARGSVGEIGLMQIRSMVAAEWAASERARTPSDRQLFDPDDNLQVGAWYLSKLVKRYRQTDNALCYALADYNAGRTHVLRWMRGAARTNSANFVAQIDFPTTQRYVQTVLERYAFYRAQFAME